jgi:uncharacterized protein with PIN domain
MMVIDTSAIAAILFNEPDAAALEGKIADDPVRLMSAATFEPLLFKGDDFTKTDVRVCL